MSRDVATSLARNTSVMLLAQMITGALSFLFLLFLPRYLGTEDYGRLYLALSIQSIFEVLIAFGCRYYIVKEVARAPERTGTILVDSLGIRVLLWMFSMLVMLGFALVVGYPLVVVALLVIFGISMLWDGARLILLCCYQGHELMKFPALGSVLERIFITILGIGVLLIGGKSIAIAILIALGALLNFAVCVRYSPRMISEIPRVNWSSAVDLLRVEFPYFVLSIFGVIYFRIDAVMLSLMTPEAVVGWYGAAYRFFDVLMFLPSIFNAALYPVLARLWGRQDDVFTRTTQRSIEMMIIAGVPMAIGLAAFAQDIIGFFFGMESFGPSAILLQIFSLGLLIIYVNFILASTIYVNNLQRKWAWVTLFAVCINIGLNLLMIPYTQEHHGNGGIGSASATIVTELYILVAAAFLLPRHIIKGVKLTLVGKVLSGSSCMLLTLWGMKIADIPWGVQMFLSGIVYIVALLVLRVFETAELSFVRRFFSLQNMKSTFAPEKGGST